MADMIHGGRLIAKALKAEGIDAFFTLCGGHIQAIYDGCLDEGIRVVDTRHEQTAAHAADGYARATGKPGVCGVTAGPGVTDAVTAVANAHRAGIPMIVFGGAGPTVFQHMGSLQDMDHCELMRPITKWSVRISETRRLAEYVSIAYRKATSGVPGPVFLEVPLDILMEMVDGEKVFMATNYRTQARPAPDPLYLREAIELLNQAEKPMAVVGSQLRWSREPIETLKNFMDKTGIPTFVNGMARGMVDPEGPHFLNRSRKVALKKADLILIFGTPFDFRLSYGQSKPFYAGNQCGQSGKVMLMLTQPKMNTAAKIIQVDLDADEIGRNRIEGVEVGIVGDTGLTLAGLAEGFTGDPSQFDDWNAEMRTEEEKQWGKMRDQIGAETNPPNPLRVCDAVHSQQHRTCP